MSLATFSRFHRVSRLLAARHGSLATRRELPRLPHSASATLASSALRDRHLQSQCASALSNNVQRRTLRDFSSQAQHDEIAPKAELQTATGRDLVLSPPALVVTRDYEWANIVVGFEQANKYSIRAAPGGHIVGYLAEESSIGRAITRNFLRTHRPFKATVFDKDQNVVFVMRRPMYLISTSIYIETPEGDLLGEVHMNWHAWRRRYKLYVDKEQFASVDSGFLAVDFDMRDPDGRKLASVNKDFTGFARELFTDARQYVLRMDPSFGLEHDGILVSDAATVNTAAEATSEMKLGHRERAVILATAIAIDFDYFSLHSRGPIHPGIMAMPGTGGAAAPPAAGVPGAAGGAGAVAGADVLSDAMNEDTASGTNQYAVSEEEINRASDGTQPEDGFSSQFDQPSDFDGQGAPGGSDSEWATFEEPDHGFDDTLQGDTAWSDDSETWSGDASSDDGEGGGFISGVIRSIFFDED